MQFDLFKMKTPMLVGLDISSSAVKIVELGQVGRGRYSIDRYVIELLPKDAVTEGNITRMEEVIEVVRTAWARLGSRARHVAMALPATSVVTKKLVLPAGLGDDEMETQVTAEAAQVVPFSLDEVNLDFQVLGPAASAGDVDVLLAASRKEKIEDRVAVAEAAGLKVSIMDIESNAAQTAFETMAHVFPENGKDQTIALIDVGASTMHILVFVDRVIVYSREQSFGGHQLTQDIQRRYGLSYDEAEQLKRGDDAPDRYNMEVLQPFTETLALEIGRAIQMFIASTSYGKVDYVVLAGGTAIIPGLDEAVAGRTEVSTMVANPFAGMSRGVGIQAERLTSDAPALVVACGLALRRFDAA